MIACFQREGRRSGKLERGKIWMEICRNWRSRRNQNCVCMHKLNASLRKTATSHFLEDPFKGWLLHPLLSSFSLVQSLYSSLSFSPPFLLSFFYFRLSFPPRRSILSPIVSLFTPFRLFIISFFFLTLPTSSTTFNNYIQRLVEEFCFNY